MYLVKEIYYTIQGEGYHVGRPAVFLRFSGCNLWSGYERDRKNAICKFCDTDFIGTDGDGGGKFNSPKKLANSLKKFWPKNSNAKPFVVCTGGEPLLQLNNKLIMEIRKVGFEIAIETNGTISLPNNLDWVCVSPKANTKLIVTEGDELKLVYPQIGSSPEDYKQLKFDHFYLQPMDNVNKVENIKKTLRYCFKDPHWKISIQTHKFLNIP